MKQHSPAAERNKQPVLEVLERVLPSEAMVLEIASGSGQHAVYFAQHLPSLQWQPTDADPVALESIEAWRAEAKLPNLLAPLALDVHEPWPIRHADALVNLNMIHISPWSATEALFRGARRVLRRGAVLVMYGPYQVAGEHTAPSNQRFDESLRARDPAWGVRDLDAVRKVARAVGFHCEEVVQMPANNLSVVYRMGSSPSR